MPKSYVKPVAKKKLAPKVECNMKIKTLEEKFNEVTKKLKQENPQEFEKLCTFVRNLPKDMPPQQKLMEIANSKWMKG